MFGLNVMNILTFLGQNFVLMDPSPFKPYSEINYLVKLVKVFKKMLLLSLLVLYLWLFKFLLLSKKILFCIEHQHGRYGVILFNVTIRFVFFGFTEILRL